MTPTPVDNASHSATQPRIRAIQVMRGIGVLLVANIHLFALSFQLWGPPGLMLEDNLYKVLFPYGSSGVDFFFVISGTIIFLTIQHSEHVGRFGTAALFVLRRAVRIYPMYWVTLLVLLQFTPSQMPPNALDVVRAVFLTNFTSPHGVSWTLVYELHFYAMVAVLLAVFGRRLAGRALLGWAVLATTLPFLALGGISADAIALDILMGEFAFGVFVGFLISRRYHRFAGTITALGLLAYFTAAQFVTAGNLVSVRVFAFGLPAALLLYGFVGLESASRIRFPRWLSGLGDISYSAYLWHIPLFWIIILHWPSPETWGGILPATVAYVLFSWASLIAVSLLTYTSVEKPLRLPRGFRLTGWRPSRTAFAGRARAIGGGALKAQE